MNNLKLPVASVSNEVAAKYIGVSPGTLNNMRSKGEGPIPTYVGSKKVVYLIVNLDKYLLQRTGFRSAS